MQDAKMWFVVVAGQTQGPMGAEDILSRLQSGALKMETMAHAEGVTTGWTPLSQIPQFAGAKALESTLPPLPIPGKTVADVIDYDIFGDDMQFVEIELDPNESVLAEAGAMMYMDKSIHMETIFGDGSAKQEAGWWGAIKGAGKRILTGESLFMTIFTHKGEGKAKVAFAAPYPGKIIVLDLKELGGTMICQKEAFLCGAKGVAIGIEVQKNVGVGLFGGEGFIMQKLEGDGLVFCHAGGTIISKDLRPGEVIKVDTGCVVGYQPSVTFDVEMLKEVKSVFFGGEGLFLATLTGPGRIWLQSIPFSRFATRIHAAARQHGGGKEEGSALKGVFDLFGGKS